MGAAPGAAVRGRTRAARHGAHRAGQGAPAHPLKVRAGGRVPAVCWPRGGTALMLRSISAGFCH